MRKIAGIIRWRGWLAALAAGMFVSVVALSAPAESVTVTAIDHSAKTATLSFAASSEARWIRLHYADRDCGDDLALWDEVGSSVLYDVPANATSLSVDLPAAWGTSATCGIFELLTLGPTVVDSYLDYIQGNRGGDRSASYLMTGVVPNQNTAVELDFTLTAVGYNQTLFCSRTSWDDSYADSLTCFVIDTKARYNFSITGTDVEDVYDANTRYVLKSFGNTAELRLHDDPLTEWTLIGGGSDSSTFTSKETVLFMSGDPSSNPVDNAGSWKLHSFKMRDGENGRPLADYVPAMKGSTAGVLDRVSGTFKTSGNTSYPFIAGSVTGAYERVKVHVGNSAAVKFLDFDVLRAGNGYFRFAVSDVWVPDGESSVTLYFATGVDADHLGEYRELAAGVTAASAITNTVEVSTGFDDVFCSVKVVHGSGEYLVGRTVSFESVVAVTALDNVARTATLAFLPTNAARQIRFYHGAQDFGDDIAQWVEAGVFASFAVPANATSLTVDLPAEWGTTSLYGRFVMNYVYDLPVDALLDWIRPNRASYNNSSYLRTGVTPNQDTAVEIDFTSVDDSFVQAMFCARTSMSSADRIVCFMTSGPLAFGYQFNDAVADSVNISVNTRYVMKTYKNSGAIYEQSDLSTPYQEFSNAGSTSATFTAPEMVLFMSGTPSSSPVDNAGSWKLHGFKLRDGENGPLLVDFVPAMKNGVAGVLDLVSETFRGSGNSRTFLAGNVVDDNPQRAVPTGDSETVVMREPHVACDVTLDGQSGSLEVSCTILAVGVGQSVADVYLVYSLNGEVTTVKMLEQSAVGSETVHTISGLSSADTIGCEVVVSNALYGSSVSLLPEYRFDVHQGAVAIIARDDDARTATVSFLPTNVVRELRFYYGDHDYGGDLELWSQRSAWTNYTVVAGADSLSVEFPSGWGGASPFGRFVMNDVYDLPVDALLDWIRPNRFSYNNSSYLRTGVTPNQDTAVEIDFTSVDDSFVQAMFCARTAQNSTDRIVCFMTGGPLAFGYQFNDAVADSVNISVNTRYVMKTYKNSGAIYEQSDLSTPYQEFSNAGSTTATFTAPEMVLFMSGTPSSSPVDNAGSWKLHGFKLRDGENGPLLVDFVPAMKNGVAGVCDLVNGTFRGSGNSCAFLAGNVVDENPKKRVPSASSATIQPKEPTASVTMSVNSQTESLDFVCEIVSTGEGKSAVDAYIVYSIDGAMNTVQLADQVAAGARCQYSIAGLTSAATVDCRLIVSNDTYGCVAFSLPPTRFDAYTFAIARILADPSLDFGAISAPTCKSVFAEFGIADQITGAVTDAGSTGARLYYSTDSNVVDRYEGSFIDLNLVGGSYSNDTAALPKSTKLYVRVISLNGDAVAVSPIVEYTTIGVVGNGGRLVLLENGDAVHIFDSAGTFDFTAPSVPCDIRYLVVGGGGAGGQGANKGGGGGGGGEVKTNIVPVVASARFAVAVGAGGPTQGVSGSASTLSCYGLEVTARGGNASGNGSAAGGSSPGGGSGTTNGNNGGGGGGAGGNASGGTGGAGIKSDITGTMIGYGGGGGGGAWSSAGAGQDGGGNGSGYGGTYTGADGRGGGGGGGGSGYGSGYRGGCGCVIVRYTPPAPRMVANVIVVETNCASAKISIELADLGPTGDSADIWLEIGEATGSLRAPKLLKSGVTAGEFVYTTEVGFTPGRTIAYVVSISNHVANTDVSYSGSFPLEGMAPEIIGGTPVKQADGSFYCAFATAGSYSMIVPSNATVDVSYLLVGGGGAGSNGSSTGGRGGCGGSVVTNASDSPLAVPAGTTLTITVGAGGVPSGGKGGDSSLSFDETAVTAAGGNGGGGTGGNGNNGAGGRGAGGAGSGGTGGPGIASDFTGTLVRYGGGGGGGAWSTAGAGQDGGGNGYGYGGTNTGADGRGGGGGGGGFGSRTGYRGGCGFVAIRYTPSTVMSDEPYGTLKSLVMDETDASVAVNYRVLWAGKNCDYSRVVAYYGLDANSLTDSVVLAESTVGSDAGSLYLPLSDEELTYYVKVRFVSDAGTFESEVKSITLPALTVLNPPEPVVDRQAMTIQFAGNLSPLGFGTTTLSVEYGGTDALGTTNELGSAAYGDASLPFAGEVIPCYHRVRSLRMKHVYYRYVIVVTAGDRELLRTTSEIRRVLVCNLATIFYVK